MEGRSAREENRLILAVADIAAMIIFSTALCMMIEVFIAKLTVFQSMRARMAAIPVNLITGRPYGIFLDCCRSLAFSINKRRQASLPWTGYASLPVTF